MPIFSILTAILVSSFNFLNSNLNGSDSFIRQRMIRNAEMHWEITVARATSATVSYTHLTLPTTERV